MMNANPPDLAGKNIVLYDGVCGFCNGFVRFILARDKAARFRFAPLQGEFAASALRKYDADPGLLDTVYVIADYGTANEKILSRARAGLFVAGALGFPWNLARGFSVLPDRILNFFYGLFARSRYRLFGKYETCPLPTPEERARFLGT